MRRALLFAFVAITLTFVAASAWSDEGQYEAFKRRMRPIAGKQVTLTGTVAMFGKLGPAIQTDDGGWVYLLMIPWSDAPRQSPLRGFRDKDPIRVTGKLVYRPARESPNELAAGIPEHFYIELGNASIVPAPAKRVVKEY